MSVGMWKGHNSSNGNCRTGMMKGYGMMLLLAFGAALCGVMLLQRFKERRILNLVIKDKDAELRSLHLLLQKENMFSKEKAKRVEDMKGKLYSLKNQKMELDRRLEEMQFTVFSMRDEQHIMEEALEEKQNEIKMLREKEGKTSREDCPSSTLPNQKEYDIEDPKHHPQNPTNVRSVSTDDSSNHPIDLTAVTGQQGIEDYRNNKVADTHQEYSTEADHANAKLNNQIGVEHSTKGEGENKNRSIADTREMDAKEGLKQKISHEDLKDSSTAIEKRIERGQVNGNERFQSVESFKQREEKHNTNTNEVIYEEDSDVEAAHDPDHEIATEGEEKLKISEGGDGQELGKIFKGENGMKVEASDGHQEVVGYKIKGRRGYGRKTKGRRRRTVAKGRGSQSNEHSDQNTEAARMKTKKIVNDALGNGGHETRGARSKKEDGHQHLAIMSIGRKDHDQEKFEVLKNFEQRREEESGSNNQRGEPDGGKGVNSFMEAPTRSAQAEAMKTVGDAGQLKTEEVGKTEGQGASRMHKANGSGIIEAVKNAEQKEAVVKDTEDLNIADTREMEEDLFDQPSSKMAYDEDE